MAYDDITAMIIQKRDMYILIKMLLLLKNEGLILPSVILTNFDKGVTNCKIRDLLKREFFWITISKPYHPFCNLSQISSITG